MENVIERKNIPQGIIDEIEEANWKIDWSRYNPPEPKETDFSRRVKYNTDLGGTYQHYTVRGTWDDENKTVQLIGVSPSFVIDFKIQ